MIGGEERTADCATSGEGVELGEDEARIRVGREAGLNRFEVEEFLRRKKGMGMGGEKKRGGEAGGNEGFAEGSVGGANKVGGKGERDLKRR